MFVNLDTNDTAYETARKCLPYHYAAAATSPHVQAMAAERLQAGLDAPASSGKYSHTSTSEASRPSHHAFLRRQRVGVGRARRQGT